MCINRAKSVITSLIVIDVQRVRARVTAVVPARRASGEVDISTTTRPPWGSIADKYIRCHCGGLRDGVFQRGELIINLTFNVQQRDASTRDSGKLTPPAHQPRTE